MKFIVPIIVLGIIMLQFYFYVKNLKRMHQFRDIFMKKDTWGISHDGES